MADIEIEPAVAVVVEKRRGDAPSAVVDTAGLRHVAERAVAVVAPQLVPAEVGQIEIDAAVVVDIAGGDAHPISIRLDSTCLSDVREIQRARSVSADLQIASVH